MNNTTVTEDLLRTASRFWLMKSEPGECSIDDALAAPGRRVSWFGIRNYQARNFMRDDMTIGDAVLFYPENRGIYTQSDSSKKSSRNIWSLAVVSVDQRY